MYQAKHKFLTNKLPVPLELIERRIFLVRGQKVILDNDLAELYQVPTKALNQAVRRNLGRFPEDFLLRLTKQETENLRSQFVTSSLRSQTATLDNGHGGRRYSALAFTEHGVAMLSSVLRSNRAIEMNILIIRAFIQLRHILAEHKDLARRLNKVELIQNFHEKVLTGVVKDINRIKNPPKTDAIGFVWRPKKINRKML